ncbi:MAG: SDR family oxidoreductase [Candidatus Omnitrophica bacterium]|nr:SDR family oxidoreductase [Candidatus Omnitrophota bacterium]MCB9720350.1 SDR family oxidoreductase [Candidatus Omnitrophota bacterium]
MSQVSIKDSVIFITGANRGIGRALVEVAVEGGAAKVYAAARDTSKLTALVSQDPARIIPVELDVTDGEQIRRAVRQAADTQILINNAGVAGYSGIIFQFNEEAARRELEVNYFGPLHLARAFFPVLSGKPQAAVANVVSVGGLSTFPMAATYSASKAAAHSLTQGLRAELHSRGITVFGIYPGPIDTDMADGIDMEKESPRNVAVRVFRGFAEGREDITTDKFADEFVVNLQADAKAVERNNAQFAHQS